MLGGAPASRSPASPPELPAELEEQPAIATAHSAALVRNDLTATCIEQGG
jgi:hypothetical protein